MNYDQVTERLLAYFTGPAFEEEITEAKNQFFGALGDGPGDRDQFEARMSQFLDWYLFSRKLVDQEMPPVMWALQSVDFKIDESERLFFANLAEARHSLFDFVKVHKGNLYVKDLFTGKRLVLKGSPIIEGFREQEIFDARIFPHEESFRFTQGFCFHPEGAYKYILKEIKAVRRQGPLAQEDLMLRLMRMRYKYDRYRHIAIEMIYSNDSKMKF